ncbi:hypothetical protein [Brucella abortus]
MSRAVSKNMMLRKSGAIVKVGCKYYRGFQYVPSGK